MIASEAKLVDLPWEVYSLEDRIKILERGNWIYIGNTLRVPRSDIENAKSLVGDLEIQARLELVKGHSDVAAELRLQAEQYLEKP